ESSFLSLMESWLGRRVLQEFNETKQKTVLLTSLKAGGVGLDLTAASNVVFKLADPWWTTAMEEEAIMRIHLIRKNFMRKRFFLEHLEKETLKWCREITWNSSTAICVLNAGLHLVMGMADFNRSDILIITRFTNFFTAGARTPRMRHSYTMEPKKLLKNVLLQGLGGDATLLFYVKSLSLQKKSHHQIFPVVALMVLPKICLSVCKYLLLRLELLEILAINQVENEMSHHLTPTSLLLICGSPSIVVAAVGGQVLERKLRSMDGLAGPFIDGVLSKSFRGPRHELNSFHLLSLSHLPDVFFSGEQWELQIRTGSLWKRNSNSQGQYHWKK
ncbi:hypothetical protein HID58_056443, partial [Brassica napus]